MKHTPDLVERINAQAGNTYSHPLQVEWNAIKQEIRRLRGRAAQVKRELVDLSRPCEVCGTPFKAIRLTRRYCSQACAARAHALRLRKNPRYDLALIQECLPAMKSAGLLSDRIVSVIHCMLEGSHATEIAEKMTITGERVGQLLEKATRTAKLVRLIQDVSAGKPSSVGMNPLPTRDSDL